MEIDYVQSTAAMVEGVVVGVVVVVECVVELSSKMEDGWCVEGCRVSVCVYT